MWLYLKYQYEAEVRKGLFIMLLPEKFLGEVGEKCAQVPGTHALLAKRVQRV